MGEIETYLNLCNRNHFDSPFLRPFWIGDIKTLRFFKDSSEKRYISRIAKQEPFQIDVFETLLEWRNRNPFRFA